MFSSCHSSHIRCPSSPSSACLDNLSAKELCSLVWDISLACQLPLTQRCKDCKNMFYTSDQTLNFTTYLLIFILFEHAFSLQHTVSRKSLRSFICFKYIPDLETVSLQPLVVCLLLKSRQWNLPISASWSHLISRGRLQDHYKTQCPRIKQCHGRGRHSWRSCPQAWELLQMETKKNSSKWDTF